MITMRGDLTTHLKDVHGTGIQTTRDGKRATASNVDRRMAAGSKKQEDCVGVGNVVQMRLRMPRMPSMAPALPCLVLVVGSCKLAFLHVTQTYISCSFVNCQIKITSRLVDSQMLRKKPRIRRQLSMHLFLR